jgi:hypothetical protein
MRQWLLWLHLASVGVLTGSMLVLLVLAGVADPVSPLTFGAVRQAMTVASNAVLVPALLLMLVTGFLLVVARPGLIDARWVWAKAGIGVLIAGVAFFQVYPQSNRATAYAAQSAAGSVIQSAAGRAAGVREPLDAALASERRGRWFNLLLALSAMFLAVWRPRLGAPLRAPAPVDGAAAPVPTARPAATVADTARRAD